MKAFYINHSNNLEAYIKITKKRDGKITNLRALKYAAKTLVEGSIIPAKVKFNDLEKIETDHNFVIYVYSDTQLIRQSTRTTGHILNLLITDVNVDCLNNCGMIYSFDINQRNKTCVKQTFFQALGSKLGKDFRDLKSAYLKNHTTISLCNDKLIHSLFEIGYNIDEIVPMQNIKKP